jgi:predicted HTH transcriptional regulator
MRWSDDPVEERLEVSDIREILDTGRSPTIEFFESVPDEFDLVKEACGLGNRSGGVILIGVNNNGELEGLEDAEECIDEIAEIFEDWIEPDFSYDLYPIDIDGSDVLVARIIKYTETESALPFAVKGQFFHRKAKRSYPMSPSRLDGLTS